MNHRQLSSLFNINHLLDSLPTSVSFVDLAYHYQFVNSTYNLWFGKTKEEIEGNHVQSIIGTEGFNATKSLFDRAFAGETIEFERAILFKDGLHHYLQVWYRPAFNNSNDIIGTYVFAHDITTTRNNRINLAKTNQELEKFAYIASHDLKTPARSVSMLAAFLRKNLSTLKPKEVEKQLQQIEKNCKNLYHLIEDTLEISQLRSHEIKLEKIDCNELLLELENHFIEKYTPLSIQIYYNNLPTIFADKKLLKAIFFNLIENATKYNDNKRIKILITCEIKNNYQFSIKDNGIGIEPAYHEKVFELFKRLHHHERIAGTGVGLAMCKRIAELHNGYIYINNQVTRGCDIRFGIPFIQQTVIRNSS